MNRLLRVSISVVVVVVVGLGLWVSPASAHTGFESSEPSDGAATAEPVDIVTLVFSGDAEPTGDGFQILDPSGNLLTPSDASTTDNRTWTLRFDPPLGGGVVGVRWSVKAPDAHPIDGAFSFTTPESEGPLAEDEASSTGAPAPTVGEAPSSPAAPDRAETEAASAAETTLTNPSTGSESVVADTLAMEEFLDTDVDPSRLQLIGVAGRALAILGTLVAVGGMVFLLTAMTGSRGEVVEVLWWIRRSGVVIIVGSVLDFIGQTVIENGTTSSIWSPSALFGIAGSSYGLAIGLRLAAGFALAATQVHTSRLAVPALKIEERIAVSVGGGGLASHTPDAVAPTRRAGHSESHRWVWSRSAWSFAGGALALVSFLFHGHTVSKGNRFVTGIADVVHVGGAAVWAGGIFMLCVVLHSRRQAGKRLQARELAARFSVVATAAIGVVGAAGVMLTVIILDSPSELWSTPWGRLLILKTLLVGLALAGGAYNHRVLVPSMNRQPDDAHIAETFRAVVAIEATVLVLVVAVTAFLIGSAS